MSEISGFSTQPDLQRLRLFALIMSQNASFTVKDLERKAEKKGVEISHESIVEFLDGLAADGAVHRCLKRYRTYEHTPPRPITHAEA